MRVPVTIGWRLAKKYNYLDNYGCPLFHGLKRAGIAVYSVSGTMYTLVSGKNYSMGLSHWNPDRQRAVVKSHRSAKFYHDTKLKRLVPA